MRAERQPLETAPDTSGLGAVEGPPLPFGARFDHLSPGRRAVLIARLSARTAITKAPNIMKNRTEMSTWRVILKGTAKKNAMKARRSTLF